MKLQFAFGNPRRKKKAKKVTKRRKVVRKKATKVKKRKKSVAKRHKRLKTKHKPFRAKGFMKRKKAKKAKKSMRKFTTLKGRKRKAKKNPEKFQVRKGGKIVHSGTAPSRKDLGLKTKEFYKAKAAYEKAPDASKAKAKARLALSKIMKDVNLIEGNRRAFDKLAERFKEEGATISTQEIGMAKKKKASKKKAKKVTKKKAVKASKKKTRKASKRKASKRKASKIVKASKKAVKTKAKKRRKAKKVKMISHKHSAKTGHFKRGTKVKFKKTTGKGRKKVTLSGFFKLNPSRRNPMSKIKDLAKSATHLNTTELTSLAIGGALVPVINSGIGKIPYADKVVGFINEYVGPQATGSLVPMIVGALANIASETFVKDANTRKHINSAADGLISAGVIGLTMSISQKYVVEGMMAGVLYSPMSGVNYTPMSGVQYTPMAGIPQLSGPDFGRAADYGGGAGYTEGHRFSKADFGRAMDEDSDEIATDDDIMSDNMSGGLG